MRNRCFVSNITSPINKMFMTLNILSLKIIVDTDWFREWNIKTSLFKISYNHITLLSDAYFPVRFRAQQRTKNNSLQLTANCIAAIRCLRHCIEMILRISSYRGHKFPPSPTSSPFIQNSNRMTSSVDRNRNFSERIFSTPAWMTKSVCILR